MIIRYQRESQQLLVFLEHIKTATELFHKDPDAVIMFSGSQTRSFGGPRSEAESYLMAALVMGWLGPKDLDRVILEEYARDSFENLLFSICRAYAVRKQYPHQLTVVGFKFKEKRFRDLHRLAVGWPEDRFHYVGVDQATFNGKETPVISESILDSERRNAFDLFKHDPFGCRDALAEKKQSRDPFLRTDLAAIKLACPRMEALFDVCSSSSYIRFRGSTLPETPNYDNA
jgi:hypothetical protein